MRIPGPDPKSDEKIAALLGAIANLNDTMAQIDTGMKTRNAVRRLGADVRPMIPGSSSFLLSSSPGRIAGYCFVETTQTVGGFVRVHDGPDENADVILTVRVFQGDQRSEWLLPGGISFTRGLYVTIEFEVDPPSIEGAIYLYSGGET